MGAAPAPASEQMQAGATEWAGTHAIEQCRQASAWSLSYNRGVETMRPWRPRRSWRPAAQAPAAQAEGSSGPKARRDAKRSACCSGGGAGRQSSWEQAAKRQIHLSCYGRTVERASSDGALWLPMVERGRAVRSTPSRVQEPSRMSASRACKRREQGQRERLSYETPLCGTVLCPDAEGTVGYGRWTGRQPASAPASTLTQVPHPLHTIFAGQSFFRQPPPNMPPPLPAGRLLRLPPAATRHGTTSQPAACPD